MKLEDIYRVVVRSIVRMIVAPAHGPVLISCPTLAGHRSVQCGVEVGGGVRPGVPGSHSLGHKVSLLPARLPVCVPQVLVLPHAEQHLAGELDHPAAVLGPLPRHVHQSVHTPCL